MKLPKPDLCSFVLGGNVGEHVLQAANMHKSGFYALNDLPENTANGYLEDRRTTNIYQLPLRGGGDGGMYTTTDDLCAFWDGLFSKLSPISQTEKRA